MDLPKLAIAALGGTVSMKARHVNEGVIPTVNGEALLASVPELKTLARINVETLGMLPSASVDFEFLLSVLSWASFQVKQGAAGVVITQGTDALEEVATFFDLLWHHDQPLVPRKRAPMVRRICSMLAALHWPPVVTNGVCKW